MKLPKHLYKHPQGCFYFVLTIPKPLQASFEGFPRLRYSLKTKNPLEAKAEAYKHTAYWLEQFQKIPMTKEPKVDQILNSNYREMVVATKGGFVSQAKTREERELDLEEIGRLKAEGITPENLIEVQKPTVRIVQAKDNFTPKEKITFQEAYKIWLDDIASIKNLKTKNAKDKAVFALKQFLNPKTRLFTVTKKDLQDFKHHLLNDVANELNTAHYKFNYITQFFEVMKNGNYYLLDNPARGQVPYSKAQKNKKAQKSKHLPFDEEEIKAIFTLENFSRIKQPHTFWGSLIAVHTGMRASEIGQLRIIDVSKSKQTINIAVSNDHQSLKTIYSTRVLPIHPRLIEIGLFDYIEDIAIFKQWQLFPNLNKTINGYGELTPVFRIPTVT